MDLLARFRMNKEISNKWFCTKSPAHSNILHNNARKVQHSKQNSPNIILSSFKSYPVSANLYKIFELKNFTSCKCQIWEFKIPGENLQNILNWIYHLTGLGVTGGARDREGQETPHTEQSPSLLLSIPPCQRQPQIPCEEIIFNVHNYFFHLWN